MKKAAARQHQVQLIVDETASAPKPPDEDSIFDTVREAAQGVIRQTTWRRQTSVAGFGLGRRSSEAMWRKRRTTATGALAAAAEVQPDLERASSLGSANRADRGSKYFQTVVGMVIFANVIALWYAAAIFLPPSANHNEAGKNLLPYDGALVKVNGTATHAVCPKPTLCSEGWGEIVLLMIARLTAFGMYVAMGLTFLTKCHSLTHFLARTYVAEITTLEYMHATHRTQGMLFALLAWLHTVAHLVRWALRAEVGNMLAKTVGASGLVLLLLLCVIVAPMLLPMLKRRITFNVRIQMHAGRLVEVMLLIGMHLHATRALVVSLVFIGVWLLDKAYMLLFRTYRLEVVELTRLEDNRPPAATAARSASASNEDSSRDDSAVGVQMLWRNPAGFEPISGEFVLVQLPWLPEGGDEWHPFSIYLREATAEVCC